jgi:hypothetical protein
VEERRLFIRVKSLVSFQDPSESCRLIQPLFTMAELDLDVVP